MEVLRRAGFKRGLTLVELLIATLIFTVSFGGILVSQRLAVDRGRRAMVQFLTLNYANGLVEAIQAYSYEDQFYNLNTGNAGFDASSAWGGHNTTIGAYNGSLSGVYADGATGANDSPLQTLPEERMTLRYRPTTIPVGATALAPFQQETNLVGNTRLLGPEQDDKHPADDLANGIFKIEQRQQLMNVFSNGGEGQEKYFFKNDVDDFDGYVEVREVLVDVPVTFTVSVSAVYGFNTGFDYVIENANGTLVGTVTKAQGQFNGMDPITLAGFQSDFPALLTSDDALSQTQRMTYGYYNNALLKKITVRAQYEYPAGSGQIITMVVDGGKVNPRGSAIW